MPFYVKRGKVPPKRHTTFYKPDGKSLYREELFSTKGFSDIYSLKYHIHLPPKVKSMKQIEPYEKKDWDEAATKYYHFSTDKLQSGGCFFQARNTYLYNEYCNIMTAKVTEDTDLFYRNGFASELIFVHRGSGELLSDYGRLPFKEYDYLVVPKGVLYQLKFDSYDDVKLFIVESRKPFEIPKHYRNQFGQLLEDAPYYERDFRPPEYMEPVDEQGDYKLILKLGGGAYYQHILPHHPFDVVGWDGYFYPYAFSIKDFEPKVGRLHLPPPVHLIFTTPHLVVCNFVPRLYDFHPDAIPAPYFHSNIDSDEVIYYAGGAFMSRKGISSGSITLHPMGMPHGPQPGKTEASIGKKETFEYAVMVDTFDSLKLTQNVMETRDEGYESSWMRD